MIRPSPANSAALVLALALVPAVAVGAVTFLDRGHVDVDWNFEDGEWSAELFDDEVFPPANRPPGETILVVRDEPFAEGLGSRITRPDDPQWDFLGVGPGEDFWILPSFNNGEPILDLGLAARGTSSDDIASPIRVELANYEFIGEGEGHFSVYSFAALFNELEVDIATVPGFEAPDELITSPGGHGHMNWAFSAKGVHRVSFVASGLPVAGDESSRISSDPVTFTFLVGAGAMEFWLLERGVDPARIGEHDSPADDGVANLLKFALGLPPLAPAPGPPGATSLVDQGGETFLSLAVPRNPAADEVAFRIETSADLTDWRAGPGHTVILADEPGLLHVRDAFPTTAARRFIRLSVERPAVD